MDDLYLEAAEIMRQELHAATPARPNCLALSLPVSWPGEAYPTDPLWRKRHTARLAECDRKEAATK